MMLSWLTWFYDDLATGSTSSETTESLAGEDLLGGSLHAVRGVLSLPRHRTPLDCSQGSTDEFDLCARRR
jgi:hypothetical protein